MGMLKEFKEFAMKGNVIDLAVGVVIGAAFGAIVGAVVDNIIMPVVGMITGGINFDALSVKVGNAELKYGLAISAAVKFLAIALFPEPCFPYFCKVLLVEQDFIVISQTQLQCRIHRTRLNYPSLRDHLTYCFSLLREMNWIFIIFLLPVLSMIFLTIFIRVKS